MGVKARVLIAGVLIVAAVGYLVITSTGDSARFFLTVEELLAAGPASSGREVTVSGAVVGSSIAVEPTLPRVKFTIVHIPADRRAIAQAGGLAAAISRALKDPAAARLEVVLDGPKPDLLADGAQAICRGRLGADGRFYADEVLLKCPARYADELPAQSEEP